MVDAREGRFLGEAPRITVAAVGVGALGSQVCLNLARAGWGQWTYVDTDYLLPHNLARHALPGGAKGMPKAAALALMVNETIVGEPLAAAIRRLAQAPEERRAMGQAGVALVRERYSIGRAVAGYEGLYDEVLARGAVAAC